MARRKLALLIGGGVIGVVAGLLLLIVWLLPTERIGMIAVDRAERMLDRQVRIEDFRIRIFPRLAVSLESVAVSRHARPIASTAAEIRDPSDDPNSDFEPLLASIDRVELRPRILPLLRGSVVINELALDGPALYLEVPEGGELEVPDFDGDEPATTEADFEIRRLLLRNGRIDYHDANTGNRVVLADIDHTLRISAEMAAGELALLALDGRLTVGRIDADVPGALETPLQGLELQADHETLLRRADDRLEVRRIDLVVQEFPLSVAGTIDALAEPDARNVSLSVSAEDVAVARLIGSIPPELLEARFGEEAGSWRGSDGRVTVAAAITGRAGGGEVPDVDGELTLDRVALAYRRAGTRGNGTTVVENLDGRVSFSLDGAASERLSGLVLGQAFEAAFEVQDLPEWYGFVVAEGAIDLAEAERAGLLPDGLRARGRATFDIAGRGATADPEGVTVDGSVLLAGIEMHLPGLGPSISLRRGDIGLSGQQATATGLAIAMGSSDLALDFDARGWLATLLDEASAPPTVTFDARSSLLDADELFEVEPGRASYGQLMLAHLANEPIDGRTAAAIAEELELGLPEVPDVRLDGRIRATTLVSNGVVYEAIDATVAARGGTLDIPGATFSAMGGDMYLSASLGSAPEGAGPDSPRPFSLVYTVSEVTADPFLEHHTLFRGRVGGSLLLTGSAQMELYPNTLPVRRSVTGEGAFAIHEGELRNWEPVRELGRTLGVADFDVLSFGDWGGRYRIVGSSILLEESMIEGDDLSVRTSGSFDAAGNLDLTATLYLPREWVGRIPGASSGVVSRALGALLGDPDQPVPVGARVTGTTASPSIGLDLSEMGAAATRRAEEEATAVRDRAEQMAEELGVPFPRPDALPPEADTLRTKVLDEVRNRLRRILPGGGG